MSDKLIEKIKKMFAMANHANANEGEAENAMRMANKLMEKHNLTSMDLHNKQDITIKFEDKNVSWANILFKAVAEVYSCNIFLSGDNLMVVGTESDTITTSIVANSLISSIRRAGKGKGNAFRNGAMNELVRQCNEIVRTRRNSQEKHHGTGLILADIYDSKYNRVLDFMALNFNLSKGKASNLKSSQAGRDYGSTLSPNSHLSNKRALN